MQNGAILTNQAKLGEPRSRLVIHDLARRNGHAEFSQDIREGLSSAPKHLFPKYLYDELGSRLFEAICEVDEYYLTRAEDEILKTHADEIVSGIPSCDTMIELGSGSAEKTRAIIDAFMRQRQELLFIPVDISASALAESSHALLDSYPKLRINAYAADYFQALDALPPLGPNPVLVLFLGSNIGNFEPDEARNFLRTIRRVLRPEDVLLLGVDLKKDPQTLEAAYNDSLGVTRAFIVNELGRINRELNANFDLWAFGLRSFYNAQAGRVEVYLESLLAQSVEIRELNMSIHLEAGERIYVESACKYDLEDLRRLGKETGFDLEQTWLDKQKRFSSNLFRAGDH
ncbi:MAG TPA: L-histidine N(alpha)-methyltransferase [Pyrinomonadaceae bacterium]|nr:L-histidine N(alpha)-methyltransferase [Pyrinomonadaceae bacterium]